jgi:anthranilate phosphoribosyltransferase
MENVCFVCTNNSFDEVSLTHTTKVIETRGSSSIHIYELSNNDFGFPKIELKDIHGGSAKENAEIIFNIFSNKEKTAGYYVVIANAALALKVAGVSNDLKECIEIAEESIQSGKTLDKLNALKEFGEKHK